MPATMTMSHAASAKASSIGPTLPFPTALVSGAQSTVAAPLSQAIKPVPNAMTPSVHRLSERDIWRMS